ncbi:hypothetical protein TrispH2_000673 [Trichoplax sp. H2]|nr:hypothetical protein TrispH2_000673 [Trichoplax sp. H2]|eukprot:RDD47894.1 hypothetical protein TrispH2_000673 [Trichoplax sp. H2]
MNRQSNISIPNDHQLKLRRQCYRLAVILTIQGVLFVTFGFVCLALLGYNSNTDIFFHSFWAGVTVLIAGLLGIGTFRINVILKTWLYFYTAMTSIASVASLVGLILCCVGTSVSFTVTDWPSIGINMLECCCYLVAFLVCLKSLIYYCRYSSEQRFLDSVQQAIAVNRLQDPPPPYPGISCNTESQVLPSYHDIEVNLAVSTEINEDCHREELYQNEIDEDNTDKEDNLPPPPYAGIGN